MGSVYAIWNRTNGKAYVGSTGRPLRTRFREHRKDLEAGRHHNRYLQNAWNKHGPAAFNFDVLEKVRAAGTLLVREQAWIDELDSLDRTCGYNLKASAEWAAKTGRGWY